MKATGSEGDWKLLLNPDQSRIELYEIKKDPTQLDILAGKYPDLVARLSAKVLAWHQELPPGPIDQGAGKQDYAWPGQKNAPKPASTKSKIAQ